MNDPWLESLSAPARRALQATLAFIFEDGDLQTAVAAIRAAERESDTSDAAEDDEDSVLGIDAEGLTPAQRVRLAELEAALADEAL